MEKQKTETCVHLRTEDGCRWCELGYHTIMCDWNCESKELKTEKENGKH